MGLYYLQYSCHYVAMCTEAWHGLEANSESRVSFLAYFHHLNLGNHGWPTWQYTKDGKSPCFSNLTQFSLDAGMKLKHTHLFSQVGIHFLPSCSGNHQGSPKYSFPSYTTYPPILQYAPFQHKMLGQKFLFWGQGDILSYKYSNDSNFYSLFPLLLWARKVFLMRHASAMQISSNRISK